MKSFHTLTVGEQEYKLRLTASAIIAIEKKLDKPIFVALDTVYENIVETIATFLWGAIQSLDENFTYKMALGLFDQYIDDGNSIDDLMLEINTLLEVSGFFKRGQAV